MTAIFALDLASKTGWAESKDNTSGVQDFHFFTDEVMGARVYRTVTWLRENFDPKEYACVYYEQAHHRGGGATRAAMAMIAAVELYCFENWLPIYPVRSGTIKKHATNKVRAGKDEMIAAALDAFPNVTIIDDNHADALWLLDWALNNQAEIRDRGVDAIWGKYKRGYGVGYGRAI